jgi:hypothetical protein
LVAVSADGYAFPYTRWVEAGLPAANEPPSGVRTQRDRVVIERGEISFEGQLFATLDRPLPDTRELSEALGRTTLPRGVILFADGRVPWPAVVWVSEATLRAHVDELRLAFRATGAAKATAPPPTSIDVELVPMYETDKVPAGWDPDGVFDRVFARCSGVKRWPPPEEDSAARRIVDELPLRLVDCHCDVDMNAVRRLAWHWWGRDFPSAPQIEVSLRLSATGTELSAPRTADWGSVAQRVAAAGRQGIPTRLAVTK